MSDQESLQEEAANPTVLASQVSKRVNLADLRTNHIRADLHEAPGNGPLTIEVGQDIAWHRIAPEALAYELRFTVTIRPATDSEGAADTSTEDSTGALDEETAPAPVFSATVHFGAVYELDDPSFEGTDDAYRAFGELSVKHTVYPYLREVIHTLTARAGLPPLVLGSFLAPVVSSSADTNQR